MSQGALLNWIGLVFATPVVLKQYAEAHNYNPTHSTFATGALIDVTAIGEQFGLAFWRDENNGLSHNLRTAVVDASLVHFAWAPTSGEARYVVQATTEGAATAAVARTTSTSASAVLDRGGSVWWVEASFTDCPTVASAPRHITTTRAPQVAVSDVVTALTHPAGIAFGPAGELYVTDDEDSVVRIIANGQATTRSKA